MQQGLKNAQHIHEMLEIVFASSFPTKADRAAFAAWKKISPKPSKIPSVHDFQLETHQSRLRSAAIPHAR